MISVSAEMPSKAQQNVTGTDSTKATGGTGATAVGICRIAPTGGAFGG